MKAAYLLLALVLFSASAAHAQVCTNEVSNRSVNPAQPVFTAAANWLQWVNPSYQFTCTGNASVVVCKHALEAYTFTNGCNGNACTVTANDRYGWRNQATYTKDASGSAWAFVWDSGAASGWVTYTCQVNPQNLANPCVWSYGTCLGWP